jgi:2-(1,2-epoxy-1,2-dihydrophenyl)acetyl-CoA isomerase
METIDVNRSDGGIVTITLNRPEKKNAISPTMWDELLTTFREIGSNDGVDRVVVLTGAGGAFCSGADLSRGLNVTERPRNQLFSMRHVADVCLALHRMPQPTIAKVGGVAAGAGANLAFGCDLIVASDEARFTEIFARRGLTIDAGGSWLLPRLIGLHRAKELAFFADIISAKEAEAFGLVNRVVPAGELDAFVDDWATKLAAGPPIALAQTKDLLNNSFQVTLEQAVESEAKAQAVNGATADTAEAMKAFLEKRPPHFEGR